MTRHVHTCKHDASFGSLPLFLRFRRQSLRTHFAFAPALSCRPLHDACYVHPCTFSRRSNRIPRTHPGRACPSSPSASSPSGFRRPPTSRLKRNILDAHRQRYVLSAASTSRHTSVPRQHSAIPGATECELMMGAAAGPPRVRHVSALLAIYLAVTVRHRQHITPSEPW